MLHGHMSTDLFLHKMFPSFIKHSEQAFSPFFPQAVMTRLTQPPFRLLL